MSAQTLKPRVVTKHVQATPPVALHGGEMVTHTLLSIVQMPWSGAFWQNFLLVPRLRLHQPEQHWVPAVQRTPLWRQSAGVCVALTAGIPRKVSALPRACVLRRRTTARREAAVANDWVRVSKCLASMAVALGV